MKSTPFVRRVNLSRLHPVIDPHARRGTSVLDSASPDELPPPCPNCRSAESTLWFHGQRGAQLVCLDCVTYQPDAIA